jgi:hypothetical protein
VSWLPNWSTDNADQETINFTINTIMSVMDGLKFEHSSERSSEGSSEQSASTDNIEKMLNALTDLAEKMSTQKSNAAKYRIEQMKQQFEIN